MRRRGHAEGIGGVRAQYQRHGKRREEEMAIVVIHLRLRLVAEVEIAHVVDYAHDGGEATLARSIARDLLADGVLVRKVLADQRLADDDDSGVRVACIGVGEEASLAQTDSHGAEVAGTDGAQLHELAFAVRRNMSFDYEGGIGIDVGERERRDQAGGIQSGQRAEAVEDSHVVRGLLRLDGDGGGQGHAQGEDAVGIEAGVDGHEALKAAQHESGAYEEDEGEGGLSNDEYITHTSGMRAGGVAAAAFFQRHGEI